MNQCDNHFTFVLPDICKVFNLKNNMWSDLAASANPRLRCPIKPPGFEIRNATIDLNYLSYLPLEGFTWTVTFKIFKPIRNVRHKKKMLFCIINEGSVVKERRNRKKNETSST